MARLQQAQGIVPGLQHLARMISSNNAFHCQGLGSALASFSSASAPDAASQMALIKALREKTSAPISDVKASRGDLFACKYHKRFLVPSLSQPAISCIYAPKCTDVYYI